MDRRLVELGDTLNQGFITRREFTRRCSCGAAHLLARTGRRGSAGRVSCPGQQDRRHLHLGQDD